MVAFWLTKAGSRTLNVLDLPPNVSGTSAVGNGVTDDTDALQATFDYLKGARARQHVVYFPYLNDAGQIARYEVSAPLRVWTHTRVEGPATIRAAIGFDWVNHPYSADPLYKPIGNAQPGNIGLIDVWNDATGRGAFSRVHFESITLDCRSQPGSIGFFGKLQQNAETRDFRIDNAETGMVLWGQDAYHERLQIGGTGVKVGVYLGADFAGDGAFGTLACKFMSFNKLNVEYYTQAAVRMDCDGPNWFTDSHFENQHASPPATARVIDARSGIFTFDRVWATHGPPDSTVIVIGDKTPPPTPFRANGRIRDWQLANTQNPEAGQILIDDRVRNKIRRVGYQRYVEQHSMGFQNDSQTDWDSQAVWWGDEGGEVRVGGLKGPTAAPSGHSGAQLTVIPNLNQDEPSVRFTDSFKVVRAGVGQKGDLFLGNYSNTARPAVAGLPNGTMIFNTTTNKPNWLGGGLWRDALGNPA